MRKGDVLKFQVHYVCVWFIIVYEFISVHMQGKKSLKLPCN